MVKHPKTIRAAIALPPLVGRGTGMGGQGGISVGESYTLVEENSNFHPTSQSGRIGEYKDCCSPFSLTSCLPSPIGKTQKEGRGRKQVRGAHGEHTVQAP